MIAYVAGPYRAKTRIGVILNIIRARTVAVELWNMGLAVICPHSNTALFDGRISDKAVLAGDIEILKRCDIVVCQGKWWESKGTMDERAIAIQCKIPVYEWEDELGMELLKRKIKAVL